MKYYLILFTSFLFLIAQICTTYFLWIFGVDNSFKALLIFGLFFFIYLFYKNLKNYSKIERTKNIITIKTFFSKRNYDLTQLTSWNDFRNYWRVSFRQLDLNFNGNIIKLMDHSDRDGLEKLYHFLRTNYSDIKNKN